MKANNVNSHFLPQKLMQKAVAGTSGVTTFDMVRKNLAGQGYDEYSPEALSEQIVLRF